MPPLHRDSSRIVIAGASSLLGVELKSLLEESRLADREIRLLDEDIAAGTLTEAGGEAAVIQPVEEGSFDRAQFVFFTGSPDFAKANLDAALHTAARVIDLSSATLADPGPARAVAWFKKLDGLLGREFPKDEKLFAIPSAAATAASALALALSKMTLHRLVVVHFRSVSEAGRAGIEELESQTGQLLSFQGVGQPVFDAQVAFNMLDRFGTASSENLVNVRDRVRQEVTACLAGKVALPAMQVLHAPVFYGAAFTACAELESQEAKRISDVCREASFVISESGSGPSNVGAAGETSIQLAMPEVDPSKPGTWWFWGAADNIRLPAATAVKLAEMLS
ncbi:MAG: hypothetical protein C5B56_07375 [Proteobacteria bacterium]|nr:MAG: hypothetical protein C5B56_07375 [Pseudomonadota bacterium]